MGPIFRLKPSQSGAASSKCRCVVFTVFLIALFAQSMWVAFRYGKVVGERESKELASITTPVVADESALAKEVAQDDVPPGCDATRYICLKKGHEDKSVLNGHPSVYNSEVTLQQIATDENSRQALQIRGDPRDWGGKNLPHTLNTWEPVYHCPFEERVGPYGDGGKWMCRVRDYFGPSCVVYSFGCNGDIRWERDVVRITGCTVHVYDPTPTVIRDMTNARRETEEQTKALSVIGAQEFLIPYKTEYHPWGLYESSSELAVSIVRRLNPSVEGGTLKELVARTGGQVPQIVKMDIEGSEWFLNFAADAETWKQVHMFMVEIHLKDIGFGFYKGTLTEWEYLRNWITQIEDLGFRIYHKEMNVYQGDGTCWELAFVNTKFF